MSITERLRRLEDEVAYRAAILDGSEAQTREATITVLGLVISYLSTKGLIDLDDLVGFLAASADPDDEKEDYNGQLINELRRVVVFHRDNALGLVERHVPVSEILTKAEMQQILSKARKLALFSNSEIRSSQRSRKEGPY